jgi:DNA-directed RNA polymerase III subunit RPC4
MVDELGRPKPESSGDGDTIMADGAATAEIADKKADRVYLFQFPPVVPDLISVSKMARFDPLKQINNNSGADQVHNSSVTPAAGGAQDPKEEEVVTIKDDTMADEIPSVFPPRPAHLPKLESGKVGKLRIYKSGKAKLDWGGVSLQLNMGITSHFLQDSVLVKTDPDAISSTQDASASTQSNGFQGSAYQFGQIRGKFVVTPDWEEVIGPF